MVDDEVQSMRRVFAYVLKPLVRSASPEVRNEVLNTLRALGKRYPFEASLADWWSQP